MLGLWYRERLLISRDGQIRSKLRLSPEESLVRTNHPSLRTFLRCPQPRAHTQTTVTTMWPNPYISIAPLSTLVRLTPLCRSSRSTRMPTFTLSRSSSSKLTNSSSLSKTTFSRRQCVRRLNCPGPRTPCPKPLVGISFSPRTLALCSARNSSSIITTRSPFRIIQSNLTEPSRRIGAK